MAEITRLLLIDDEEHEYLKHRDALADHNLALDWAPELDDAFQMLQERSYLVVLVDLLFGTDWGRGFQIIREIKRRYPRQELILLTNYLDPDRAVTALQEDAYSAVQKGELRKLRDEIRKACLKQSLACIELARGDFQALVTDSNLSGLLISVGGLERPAEKLLEIALVVRFLERLDSLSRELLRLLTHGTHLQACSAALTALNDEGLKALTNSCRNVVTPANREVLGRVVMADAFCLNVNRHHFIKLLFDRLLPCAPDGMTDRQKIDFMRDLLTCDDGLLALTGRNVGECLLGWCEDPDFAQFNVSSLVQLRAGKHLAHAEEVASLLGRHVHVVQFARELSVLELLLAIQRRYQPLCELSDYRLESGDWLEMFRDQLIPLMGDSRSLYSHQAAFPALEQPLESCRVLVERYNRKFVAFLWDERAGYRGWVSSADRAKRPRLTCDVLREVVLPAIHRFRRVLFIVFDGMSLLSWHRIRSRLIGPLFDCDMDDVAFAVLPTATRYARSAIFAGQLPRSVVPSDPQSSPNERRLLADALTRCAPALLIREEHFLKYEELRDRGEDEQKKKQLQELLAQDVRLSVIIFDPHDKVTHVAPGFAEDFSELFYEKTIHPIMESVARMPDVGVVITSDHGFCEIRELKSARGIFREASVRDSDVEYAPHVTERRGHFGKRYIDLGDRQYAPRRPVEWLRVIEHPADWGLPDSNGFLIATGPCGFAREEGRTRMFAHGGASLEEMIVPVVVLKTKAQR